MYRVVAPAFADSSHLLSGIGAMSHSGRWHPAADFRVVHGATEPETALAESLSTQRYYGVSPAAAPAGIVVAVFPDRLELGSRLEVS